MARCVARYAVALLLDAMRFIVSWEDLVERAKLVDPGFGLSATTLKNLMKLHKDTPRQATQKQLYALINRYLERCNLPAIPSEVVELALTSDYDRSTSEKALRRLTSGRDKALWTKKRVSKIRSEISLLQKRMEWAASDRTDARPMTLLWLALTVFVDSCEIADLIGDEEHSNLPKATALHEDSDRAFSLQVGIDVLEQALPAIVALEEQIEWHVDEPDPSKREPKTQKRLGTMRLLVEANRAITTAMSIQPGARVGSNRVRAVWTGERPMQLWEGAQPVARTSRLLRNFIELAQYTGDSYHVLELWEFLRTTEEGGFVKGGLSHNPKSWGLSIEDDKLMCCAARLIYDYESKLEVSPLLREVDTYRKAVMRTAFGTHQIVPCKGTCARRGLMCQPAC